MLETKFVARARAAVNYANEEAMRLNHVQIDTEHLLLGLLHEGRGIAVRVLRELGVNLEKLEMEVKAMIKKSSVFTDVEQPLEFTNAANQVLQYATEEAQKVESDYVYTEHILMGLIREIEGIAAKALANSGVTLEKVRELLDLRPMLEFQNGRKLDPNSIDKAIRDLVYLLNEVPFLETSSSCSGHPDYYKSHSRTDVWRDGEICLDPIEEIDQAWNFFEFIRTRLDNSRGIELSRFVKKPFYINRPLGFYQQVNGEKLYTSSIPILAINFWSLIWLNVPFEKLHLMWDIVLKITQEFISSREKLPPIETPKVGAETFVNLLQSVPHIQEILAFNRQSLSRGGLNIFWVWNRDSIRWGWNLMNYLKTHIEEEEIKHFYFRTSFAIKPIVKRDNLQRTREDHLKIWKLIELAVREFLDGETTESATTTL